MAKNLTEVRLLAVPLENDYLHTLYFSSKSAQETYFKSKQISGGLMDNCTYQRKDHYIRFNKQMDSILKCNYVMYKNPAYSDKWFYAFVTKMEYIDDGRTDIYIETDVIQTWLFDYNVKPSFVEREHCSNDTVGLHTVPEGLETGEYICNEYESNYDLTQNGFKIILATTLDLSTLEKDDCKDFQGGLYNGVYSGVQYYAFGTKLITQELNSDDPYYEGVAGLNRLLEWIETLAKSSSIISIFMAPDELLDYEGEIIKKRYEESERWGVAFWRVKQGTGYFNRDWKGADGYKTLQRQTDFDGWVPNNNKVLTYPYTYLLMDNNAGGSAIYQHELFEDNNYTFRLCGAITPGCSIRLVPAKYNGCDFNNGEGLTGGKFPICSWNTDVYTNWLTQNAVNIGISLVGSGLQVVGGAGMIFTGGGALAGASSMTSGVMGIANTIGEMYSHSLQPAQAEGNINSGDVTFSMKYTTFTAKRMSIKKEFAQVIDGYFDMYGYKTNLVKTPAKNHRKNYWFTKTIDCNIDGAIPMDDMKKIKECYNKGITFWKNADNIGNYSVDNSIV